MFLCIVHRFLGPMGRLKVLKFLGNHQLEILCNQTLTELFAGHYFKEYQTILIRQLDWSVMEMKDDFKKSHHHNYIRELFNCIETDLERQHEVKIVATLYGLTTLLKLGLEKFKSASSYEVFEGRERKQEMVTIVSFSLFIEFMRLIHCSHQIRLLSHLKPLIYSIFHELLHLLIEQHIYQPINEESSKQRIRFFVEFFRTYIVSQFSQKELEISIGLIILDLIQLDHRILEEFLDIILGHYLMVSDDNETDLFIYLLVMTLWHLSFIFT